MWGSSNYPAGCACLLHRQQAYLYKPAMRLLSFLLLFCTTSARAQPAQAVQLRCRWFDTSGITPSGNQYFSDVWGFTDKGVEYGVIGSTKGAHIIRISDCQQVAFFSGRNGGLPIPHRDYKTYRNYLYAVADEGPATLQVFDVSFLPDSLHLVYESSPDTPLLAHTLFIDTAAARLYLASPKGASFGMDYLRVYSLADPKRPRLTHRLNAQAGIRDKVHTIFARNDTAYLSASNYGLIIGRFNAADQFSIIGELTGYPQQGYNHSSWIGANGAGIMADETHGLQMKALNTSRLPRLRIESYFSPCSGDTCVPHNTLMKGDYAFIAHYYQGLQIYSLADPSRPVRTGYFDTYAPPAGSGGFAGAWGCYPFFSGNKVLISDMQTGLYVVDASAALGVEFPENTLQNHLTVSPNPATTYVDVELQSPLNKAATIAFLDGISGKLVLEMQFPGGTSALRVPLPPQAAAGLYFIRLTSETETTTVRFFKN